MKPTLDDRQQRLAYVGAAVAAVGFVAAQWARPLALVGLAMAALLAVGARRRSVTITAGAAFAIALGPWDALVLLGAPYLAFGGVLMYRASKLAAEAAGPRRPRPPRRKARQQPEPPAAEKKPPPRSKRYTPPKR